jgi:hypothetical protein
MADVERYPPPQSLYLGRSEKSVVRLGDTLGDRDGGDGIAGETSVVAGTTALVVVLRSHAIGECCAHTGPDDQGMDLCSSITDRRQRGTISPGVISAAGRLEPIDSAVSRTPFTRSADRFPAALRLATQAANRLRLITRDIEG